MRPNNRSLDQLRDVSFEAGVSAYAEGSCLVKFGGTHVLCTASIDEGIPRWLKGKGRGWVTAEYGMLPRSTHTRNSREAARGKQSGRTIEISRLIGRSLRAVIDLEKLGERQIIIDCDVMQADGGTRTASISGGWVALWIACETLVKSGELTENPVFAKWRLYHAGLSTVVAASILNIPKIARRKLMQTSSLPIKAASSRFRPAQKIHLSLRMK